MGGSGVGRTPEDDELAAPDPLADLLQGPGHVRDVGVLGLGERGGNADVDHVAGGKLAEVDSRLELALLHRHRHLVGGHVVDVGGSLLERPDLVLVELEAGHPVVGLGELDRQRQPHVAEADHADACLSGLDAPPQLLQPIHESLTRGSSPRTIRGSTRRSRDSRRRW